MKKPTIVEYIKPFDLSEVYQKSGLRYAFISAPKDGSEMCHPFVKCRDFLHDAVRAMILGSKCEIYGFKYDSKVDPPIDLKRIRMRLKYDGKNKEDFEIMMQSSLKLLHYYEEIMGGKVRTSKILCDDGMYVVSGPSVWLKSPILTTLFTMLFRIAEHLPNWDLAEKRNLTKMYEELIARVGDKIHTADFKDILYLSQTYKYLHPVVQNIDSLCTMHLEKYDPVIFNDDFKINTYHNYGGIVSLCNNSYMSKERLKLLPVLMDEYKEGKALMRVVGLGTLGPYNTYQPHKARFAFVTNLDDARLQCSTFSECKEQVIAAFRNRHADNDHQKEWEKAHWGFDVPNVDDTKLRLLVCIPGVLRDRLRMAMHKKELFFAKRTINYYEKYLGMKKSVISTVLIKYKNGEEYAWLFTASEDWLASPVMLGLYITIIRSAKSYFYNHTRTPEKYPIPDVINSKEVKKMWSILNKNSLFVKNLDSDIHKHSSVVHKVLKNRKILFGAGTIQEKFFIGKKNLLPNTANYAYHTASGINSLIKNSHVDKKLVTKFKELEK